MKKSSKCIVICLAAATLISTFTGCGSSKKQSGSVSSTAKDTVTALLPPVSSGYQKRFTQMQNDFHKKYPNLTLKIEQASWENIDDKLDVEANSGNPPDVSFTGSDNIAKYLQTGLLVNISKYASKSMINDFDSTPLGYMKNGSGLYGFPAYIESQTLGGNKADLEAAGIDWKSIQKNGWTWDEFRKDIKKGVVKENSKTSRYGFVFACSGVTASDLFNELVDAAGIPYPFNSSGKYAYTNKKLVTIFQNLRDIINDGSAPASLSAVDAGKRWNMFLTNQTMITGKGMANFENLASQNNEKLDKNDNSAVKDSVKVDYIVLPMPSIAGGKMYARAAVDGYVVFRSKSSSDAHITNSTKAAYFLSSGKVAAQTNTDLYLTEITKTGEKAAKSIKTSQSDYNIQAEKRLISVAAPARPDISSDKLNKATKILDQVIVPKFQSLLAGESTPQQVYDAIKKEAVNQFGSDGVVQ